jgi:hypothetical protein
MTFPAGWLRHGSLEQDEFACRVGGTAAEKDPQAARRGHERPEEGMRILAGRQRPPPRLPAGRRIEIHERS